MIRGDSIATRDLGHIHHRLSKLGHSPRKVALLLFAASGLLALASLLLLSPNMQLVGIAYAVLGVIAFIGLQRLRVPELLELRGAIARGLQRSSSIWQNVALREALDTMAGMESWFDALDELGRAFETTDFLEAEIRLLFGSTERETDRVVWRWKRPRSALRSEALDRSQVVDLAAARHSRGEGGPPAGAYREDVHWEARLPLIDPDDGALEGWLTIRRPWGTYLPSELDVLARELLPRDLRDGVADRGESVPRTERRQTLERSRRT